jgi:hypothetical protein
VAVVFFLAVIWLVQVETVGLLVPVRLKDQVLIPQVAEDTLVMVVEMAVVVTVLHKEEAVALEVILVKAATEVIILVRLLDSVAVAGEVVLSLVPEPIVLHLVAPVAE